ncbi:uncharacterized protein B0T15DRAFT_512975 [Chaetomium strumarium]|uniref:Uncharacterized protein n=1 Tax=Chaetomium strumarium TaxID=1170767 RepID=A0AAJ0GRR5_9PEZI|nr:hypothetical protein B0T15DRAFT_512975 [Chaetomium strumarium]
MVLGLASAVGDATKPGPSNKDLRAAALNAIKAIEMVTIMRKIDYESFRMPAMESADEFTGDRKVNFKTWELVLPGAPKARELDLEATIEANPSQSNIAERIARWEEDVYLADNIPNEDGIMEGGRLLTKGEIRSYHKAAIRTAERAERLAKNLSC